jgi:hypothetical protein
VWYWLVAVCRLRQSTIYINFLSVAGNILNTRAGTYRTGEAHWLWLHK